MKPKAHVPIATILLIAANIVAAYLLALEPELIQSGGFHSDQPTFLQALTSLFLHENILHLLGNMVFLAAVGVAVELATGTSRFLLVYFAGGFAGVLAHLLLGAKSGEPLIGASGAIASCVAYYSARYIGLKVVIGPGKGVSVATVTAVWVLLQLLGAVVRIGGEQGGVSYWSHIGGLLAGLILSAVFRAPDLGQRMLGHKVLDEMNSRGPSAALTAAQKHLEDHPDDPKALLDLARAAAIMGEEEIEIGAMLGLLKVLPELEQKEVFVRLAELDALDRIPALQCALIADRYATVDPAVSELLLVSVIAGRESDPSRPDAMLSLAALKRESDPQIAKQTLKDLLEQYPLHPSAELARLRGWV